jgi:DnaK suppressor protein
MAKERTMKKTRYTDKELKEFEAIIDEKLAESRRQLEFYEQEQAQLADNPDAKLRGLDDATGSIESEHNVQMIGRMIKHIQHLENAKIRIKNKVYGICRETGRLISKERLKAVPHATLSVEAKEKRK